ncbi:MCP four helix bundle domain-containing protein [Pedobacter sp. UC225_61]|uniref:MCP four helix bundle domain-containing protein n=1 Tax=Pedobacter sp. UC225_61 TaxID=3374623 RepID=UPI0037B3A3E8
MKIAFSIQQKSKIALLLFCIMICTILIRFLEDKSIKSMNNAFVSMYNDRLVPATDLFHISELLFDKKDILEKQQRSVILEGQQTTKLLDAQDFKIDSVLKKYEQTFLVTNEKDHLQHLKEKLKAHQQLEKQLVSASKGDEVALEQLNISYKSILQNLSLLTKTQIEVGKELIKESQSLFTGSKIYSAIQFALAIVIGVLIVSIIFASNVMKVKQDKFNLN